MGEVYAGRHAVIGKRVAIKLLRSDLTSSPEGAERFIREARAAVQIDHPNVIDVFGFGRHDDRLYLVMDLVDGRPNPNTSITLGDRKSTRLNSSHVEISYA